MSETKADGTLLPDGSWQAAPGSPYRSLTVQEVADLRHMAETTIPNFEGPHNAPWEGHHPLAREIWSKKGIGPKGA